ncbi:GNAT family N-acetyltransferase [Leptolyngbya sp. 'hensonii']|uniref:GNAT family N-acetyltransferase n=1 Tax=Leptolyngbya sp. 'hensonii' TaxID=1922337 RepID=UPI00094FC05F|nr:GNAT family N-acetyltransferase [Leptolyngbya sp. 'hensonii']OLP17591.1 GNAT family N-acetyltransferase [Leptolyngbya sp. 'hensonii']
MDKHTFSNYEVGAPTELAEAEQFCRIVAQCFNAPITEEQAYIDRLGIENFRIIRKAGQVVGGLQIYPMGQWYGRHRLEIAGIAAVAIAPEHRGSGVATTLLTQVLQSLHATDIPLAVLYASTQRLYRKVGFEQAGIFCRFSVPAKTLISRHRRLEMIAVDPQNWQIFADLYQQQAIANNGNLDRHPVIWQRIVHSSSEPLYAYLIGSETNPQGYVILHHQAAPGGYSLNLRDVVTLTAAAQERLWTFLADHRSLADQVLWRGPMVNPSLLHLPEQTYQVSHLERWFVRLVDVPLALAMRGYPEGIEAELHLEVQDDLIEPNNGRFVLTVSQGEGRVTPGGRGELQIPVRGLSPLFTGLLTPDQLHQAGYLTGTSSALATATLLFSGPEPWMADHF